MLRSSFSRFLVIIAPSGLPVEYSGKEILSSTFIGGFRYLMSRKNIVMSEAFWDKVCFGLALDVGDPAAILRKKLISDKLNTASIPSLEKRAFIIKAWNYYRKGDVIKFIRWDKNKEKFPKII